jgi:predicted NBD/HSP70 family sugar kinase
VSIVAGIDLGGTAINYTFIDANGRWLIDGLCEHPARATDGPEACLRQIAEGLEVAASLAGIRTGDVVAVGLDTPGPATADGVLSMQGSTNFVHPDWIGFDIRTGLERLLAKPVAYLNDGNAG